MAHLPSPYITSVKVDGMHSQFDVDITLKPGLNVLYGQNGRGKTTLLHLIANTMELDFDRFKYLKFNSIVMSFSNGSELFIHPAGRDNAGVQVSIDGNLVNWQGDEDSLADLAMLRGVVGNRPNYLPAFRSILERVRNDNSAMASTTLQAEFERLRSNEHKIARRSGEVGVPRGLAYSQSPESLVALKTIQCREWFGPFVPMIRYPSIVEVRDRLETEFREAAIEIAASERSMFSDFFLGTMRALLSAENKTIGVELDVETLLERIKQAVVEEEGTKDAHGLGASVMQQIREAVNAASDKGKFAGEAEKRVLRLYAESLEKRVAERKRAFEKIRLFETAINKFLDNKTLHITEGRRLRGDSGTHVEAQNKHQYPLTSLSSGERQVLTMLFTASRLSSSAGIFLVDEPELSLHVDWQRIILSELMRQSGGRQIVACTHSPEVGADHLDAVQMFEPTSHELYGSVKLDGDLLDDVL